MFGESQKAFPFYGLLSSPKISIAKRILYNKIARFQIQNFLVRLYSILQYYGVYNNLTFEQCPQLIVLKRLRNKFGHSLESFTKEDSVDKNTMRKIIQTFNLEDKEYADFPIYEDWIINAILEASIQYVIEHYP